MIKLQYYLSFDWNKYKNITSINDLQTFVYNIGNRLYILNYFFTPTLYLHFQHVKIIFMEFTTDSIFTVGYSNISSGVEIYLYGFIDTDRYINYQTLLRI